VFLFLLQLLSEKLLVLRRIQRDIIINVYKPSGKVPFIPVRFELNVNFTDRFLRKIHTNFMKIHPTERFFRKIHIKFHENPSYRFFFEKYIPNFMKIHPTDFFRKIHIKFHENPSSGNLVVQCGRKDRWTERERNMTNLIVAFRNFATPPKNASNE